MDKSTGLRKGLILPHKIPGTSTRKKLVQIGQLIVERTSAKNRLSGIIHTVCNDWQMEIIVMEIQYVNKLFYFAGSHQLQGGLLAGIIDVP